MRYLGYRILTWSLIAGPFVVCLIWFLISRRIIKKIKAGQSNPGCVLMSSQVFSVIFMILSVIWGIFWWLMDAMMSSM